MKKKIIYIIVGILLFCCISSAILSQFAPDTIPEVQQKEEIDNTNTESVPTIEEVKSPTLTPEPTQEPIESKVSRAINDRDIKEILYNSESKTVILKFKLESFWDNADGIRTVYFKLVDSGKELFPSNLGIEKVIVQATADFTDSYGKESETLAMNVGMSKQEFEKYNWKNLEYQPIYNQMSSSCDPHYIHPAFLDGVNYEKIYLKSF